MSLSLVGVKGYIPPNIIGNEFFGSGEDDDQNIMFKGAKYRHHISPTESAQSMIAKCAQELLNELNLNQAEDIDIILTNVTLTDNPFTGCGAELANQLKIKPKFIYDLHNTGCVSFIFMMELAEQLMASGYANSAIICNAQTSAGRIFALPDNRIKPQAAIPGDGAGVAFLNKDGDHKVLGITTGSFGQYASDMQLTFPDNRNWWEPGEKPGSVDFTEGQISKIIARGNKLVPKMIYELLKKHTIKPEKIDFLITNQPNPIFLRNWREAIMLPKDRHIESFKEHGNMFGATIPINLERTLKRSDLKKGDLICLAGFAHAGDYAAASLIEY